MNAELREIEKSRVWFHAGLKFSCTNCGRCCSGAPGYVWVEAEEIAALAAALSMDTQHFERRFVRRVGKRKSLIERENGDCVFLGNVGRRCLVYEARPRQCRTWPFWTVNVASLQAWEAVARNCPGCNHGRLFSAAEIVALLE